MGWEKQIERRYGRPILLRSGKGHGGGGGNKGKSLKKKGGPTLGVLKKKGKGVTN